jgi:hypothetical protein
LPWPHQPRRRGTHNPLKDIALLQRVDFVMKAGVVYERNNAETP